MLLRLWCLSGRFNTLLYLGIELIRRQRLAIGWGRVLVGRNVHFGRWRWKGSARQRWGTVDGCLSLCVRVLLFGNCLLVMNLVEVALDYQGAS